MGERAPIPVAAELPSEQRPRPPYGLLLGVLLAGLAISVLGRAFWMLADLLPATGDVMRYFRVQELVFWISALALLVAVGLVWSRLPPSRPRRLAGAATLLFALGTGLWGLMSLPELLGGEGLFGESPIQGAIALAVHALSAAGEVVLFVGLTFRARAAGVPAGTGALAAFVALRLLRTGLVAVRTAIPASATPELLLDPAMITALSLAQLALFAACIAFLSVLLVRLRAASGPAGEVAVAAAATAPSSGPERDLLIGLLALGAGLLVTAGSYAVAVSTGGGSYAVTTGLVVYGLFRIGRAAFRRGGGTGAS